MIRPRLSRSRVAGRLTAAARCERGAVTAVAVIALLIVILIAVAVSSQAISVSSKSNQDPLELGAVQAADTGLQTALYRLNALYTYTTDSTYADPCPIATVDANHNVSSLQLQASTTIGSSSWCPASPVDTTGNPTYQSIGNGESFSYQMTPILSTTSSGPSVLSSPREIVATGWASNGAGSRTVVARVRETASVFSPSSASGGGLVAQSSAAVQGSAAVGSTSNPIPIYSDGSVSVSNNTTQCGALYYYTSFTGNSSTCSGNPSPTPLSTQFQVPQATVQQPTSGMACSTISACDSLLYSLCTSHCTMTSNSTTASLTLNNQGTLAIPPGVYELCSLSISNGSSFQIGTSAQPASASNPVVIYIQPPSLCGSTTPLVGIQGGSLTTASGPNSFIVEVFGSSSPTPAAVNVNGNSNSTLAMTIIAPNSSVTINGTSGNLLIQGFIVANTLTLAGTTQYDTSAPSASGGSWFRPQYQAGTYTECSATIPSATSSPDQGC